MQECETWSIRVVKHYSDENLISFIEFVLNYNGSGILKIGLQLGLMLTILTVSATLALPENVALGNYDITFDLGGAYYPITTEDMTPEDNPNGIEYASHICWLKGDGTMMIALTDYGRPVELSIPVIRTSVINYLNGARCKDIQTHEVTIDLNPAVLGLGQSQSGETLFCAIYWPYANETDDVVFGNTECTIASTAPVEVTESLLNTVRVELREECEDVVENKAS